MRRISTLILGIITLATTACIHEFPVTDYSFDFSGAVVYDQEADQHRLTLTCNKHSGAEQYSIVFHVDGENVITLTDIEGNSYKEWFRDSFSQTDSHTYILSHAPVGSHTVQLTISTDDFCQSMEIPYEVTRQKYDIHAEVSTIGAENSTLMMSLANGETKYLYDVVISIDNELMRTYTVDFSQTPIASIDLPDTIRPHEHTLTLFVNDSMTDKEYTVKFTEPVRHPTLDIILAHDDKSGYHIANIGPNPYSILVEISAELELKGKVSYYPSDDEDAYWWGRPYYKYLTEQKSEDLSESKGDRKVNILDRDGMAESITSRWETSFIWKGGTSGGDGENSGEEYSYISGSFPAFYQIYSEILKMDISAEALPGVTLIITNNIGKMTINGKSSTSGATNITL